MFDDYVSSGPERYSFPKRRFYLLGYAEMVKNRLIFSVELYDFGTFGSDQRYIFGNLSKSFGIIHVYALIRWAEHIA